MVKVLIFLCVVSLNALAVTKNGFLLDDASVSVREIVRGGPPRNGIFALSFPRFHSFPATDFMKPEDPVLGVFIGNVAKAYPLQFLTIHEIVNDKIGVQFMSVSYCPLCGSGVVFATNIGDSGALNFGVSGLLYNSDLLLYDRKTEFLWTQVGGESISGQLKGTILPRLPVMHTT